MARRGGNDRTVLPRGFGPAELTDAGRVSSVAELVDEHIEKWQMTSVELDVFGTAEPAAVASHFETIVERGLGSSIASGLFYGSSSGCVLGAALTDGRRVVIKAYQRRWTAGFLGAVRRIQKHLSASGFPCPPPLLGPLPAGPALATIEEFVADPGMRILSTGAEMRLSAAGLARQIRMCRGVDVPALAPHPLRAMPGRLYPEPHNPIFDLSLNSSAARWIDKLAQAARAVRDADESDVRIAHTDWSARNVRFDDTGVIVAYDWDSLSLVTEPVAVGQAAATWRSTGDAEDPIAPDAEEVDAYATAYGAASGSPFSAGQRRAVSASALYVLAYTARCEHALQVATGRRVERARARLASGGQAYLA